MKSLLSSLTALATCHWLAMAGVAVTVGSVVVFISLSLLPFDNPYFGILLFLLLPAFFLLGLGLIPIGIRQKSKQVGGYRALIRPFEWRQGTVMRLLIVLGAATGINVVLLSSATWQGSEYMDSADFCGTVCHAVMGPQFAAYQESAHAEVGCVSCHVGSQASSFLYHKVDGLRQVFELATDSYPRPIPSSSGRMHTAEETCGSCHRLDAWTGETEKLSIIRHYADDEASSERTTVLLLPLKRIHDAHQTNTIDYVPEDDTLMSIPWVQVGDLEYVSGERPDGELRSMDCIDCHNRAGHDFRSPEAAVDRAIRLGELDRSVPYARRDAIRFLVGDLPLSEAPQIVRELQSASVFPEMEVVWDTYTSNTDHESALGCFRCHDSAHRSPAGEVISQGCNSCHTLLAIEEEGPEILERFGITD